MKKFAYTGLAALAFTLTACGGSDKASEEAQAENVELPAEEAVGTLDEEAMPVEEVVVTETETETPAATTSSAAQ